MTAKPASNNYWVLKKLLKLLTLHVIFTTLLIYKEGFSNLTLNSAAIRLLQPTPTESNLEMGAGIPKPIISAAQGR